jgi:hypothetical protein
MIFGSLYPFLLCYNKVFSARCIHTSYGAKQLARIVSALSRTPQASGLYHLIATSMPGFEPAKVLFVSEHRSNTCLYHVVKAH